MGMEKKWFEALYSPVVGGLIYIPREFLRYRITYVISAYDARSLLQKGHKSNTNNLLDRHVKTNISNLLGRNDVYVALT